MQDADPKKSEEVAGRGPGAPGAANPYKRRPGRPPASAAGDVEERLLRAATEIFLMRGYEGAAFAEVAARAGAGKATLYARFKTKEELLSAVVRRTVETLMLVAVSAAEGPTVRDRLTEAGVSMVEQTLTEDTISLMRLVIAEGGRFPELARHVHCMARERSVVHIVAAIRGRDGEFADETMNAAAHLFLDLVFMPFAMKALMGEDLATLRTEVAAHVAAAVKLVECADSPD